MMIKGKIFMLAPNKKLEKEIIIINRVLDFNVYKSHTTMIIYYYFKHCVDSTSEI